MSSHFDVLLDPSSLERSPLGSITGRIAIQSGDVVFPESRWRDFPVILIRWWIDAARALESGSTGRFLFMDGPFEFTATPLGDGWCELSFIERTRSIVTTQAPVADVIAAIRRAANRIVEECRSRGWQQKEVDEMANDTVVLFRPIGPKERALLEANGWKRWPPRLSHQPIFYPVTNQAYATEIASKWNVRESGAGYVTRFEVRRDFISKYEIHTVGAAHHTEWWIPAKDLEELNDNLVGEIEIVASFDIVTAIHNGDLPTLEALLAQNPALATERIEGRTLLHILADWPGHRPNSAQAVQLLVRYGADVNARMKHPNRNEAAETPLHWAASSDDVALIDALLDAGADIEANGAIFTGGTPMSDAVVFAQWNAARRLLERGAKTTFWQAAALGLLEEVRAHTAPSKEEITNAFWNACRGGQREMAEYLLNQGADPNWIGHDRKTPLDVARESGNQELMAWLLSSPAPHPP